jgi:hypothetical protein
MDAVGQGARPTAKTGHKVAARVFPIERRQCVRNFDTQERAASSVRPVAAK